MAALKVEAIRDGVPYSWRGKKVLVTGATGFIGRRFVAGSRAAGVHVQAVSGPPEGRADHAVELTDEEAVRSLLAGVVPDAVVHLAASGVSPSSGRSRMVNTNVMGLQNLLLACTSLDVAPSVVVVGSGFEYAPQNRPISETDPILPAVNAYGAAKAAGSIVAASFRDELPIALLRPFNVYGPGESPSRIGPAIIAAAGVEERVLLTEGEQLRDFLHVDDFSHAIWRSLPPAGSAPGLSVYNVGSGQPRTVRSFAETLGAALAARGRAPILAFGALPYRAGEPMVYVPDVSRIEEELGFQASISLESGLNAWLDEIEALQES